MRNDNITLDRVSLKLEHSVKQWYADKSATYGMPMAAFMQFILTNYYEGQMNNEAVRNLSALNGNGDLKDTNKQMTELLEFFNGHQIQINKTNEGEN